MGTSKKGFYCYLFNNWSQVIYLLGSLLTRADALAIPPGVLKKEIIVFNKLHIWRLALAQLPPNCFGIKVSAIAINNKNN